MTFVERRSKQLRLNPRLFYMNQLDKLFAIMSRDPVRRNPYAQDKYNHWSTNVY